MTNVSACYFISELEHWQRVWLFKQGMLTCPGHLYPHVACYGSANVQDCTLLWMLLWFAARSPLTHSDDDNFSVILSFIVRNYFSLTFVCTTPFAITSGMRYRRDEVKTNPQHSLCELPSKIGTACSLVSLCLCGVLYDLLPPCFVIAVLCRVIIRWILIYALYRDEFVKKLKDSSCHSINIRNLLLLLWQPV